MKKNILLGFLLLSFVFSYANDQDAAAIYKEANLSYQKMDYKNAALMYEKLLSQGHLSPEVYYNLGNSYFKDGNVPKAILNYERAKKMSPEDEDVDFNLKIANLKVVDRIDTVPEMFYKRWINAITGLMSVDGWSIVLIVMFWLTFGAGVYYVMATTVNGKRNGLTLILIMLGLTGVTYLLTGHSYSTTVKDEHAIIMSSSVYVKSSPDEKGTDQFILHEGTKVDILEPFEDWKKIRIANGSIGWVKSGEMERI